MQTAITIVNGLKDQNSSQLYYFSDIFVINNYTQIQLNSIDVFITDGSDWQVIAYIYRL